MLLHPHPHLTIHITCATPAHASHLASPRRMVLQQAEGHNRLCRELGGPPLDAGPWYNSSVTITHDGRMATVTMPVRGGKRSSDVTLRVRRKEKLCWCEGCGRE